MHTIDTYVALTNGIGNCGSAVIFRYHDCSGASASNGCDSPVSSMKSESVIIPERLSRSSQASLSTLFRQAETTGVVGGKLAVVLETQ